VKIYTKSGDGGETGLFGGPRVPKDDARVEAYGAVDELNAALGAARARNAAGRPPDAEVDEVLAGLQQRLFAVGADLATPPEARARASLPPVEPAWVEEMERRIDGWEERLPPLHRFVLPGGDEVAALLHQARTTCRRAERRVVSLHRQAPVGPVVLPFLNRLADLLFVLARTVNHRRGAAEPAWEPVPKGKG
jgi:cob(I)alamin adenosyltransferase